MHNSLFCEFSLLQILQKKSGARIVGGEEIDIIKVPWQVNIQTAQMKHHCGGSIISEQWILSAAHCFYGDFFEFVIFVGATKHQTEGRRVHMEAAFIHPEYDRSNTNNDFILIKLKEKLQFNDNIQAIRLPEASDTFENGRMCLVTGWGYTGHRGEPPDDNLRGVEVPIVDQQKCNDTYGGRVSPNMICAGFYDEGGKDGKYKHFLLHNIL